jgi:hypothetical protein
MSAHGSTRASAAQVAQDLAVGQTASMTASLGSGTKVVR